MAPADQGCIHVIYIHRHRGTPTDEHQHTPPWGSRSTHTSHIYHIYKHRERQTHTEYINTERQRNANNVKQCTDLHRAPVAEVAAGIVVEAGLDDAVLAVKDERALDPQLRFGVGVMGVGGDWGRFDWALD